MLVFPHLLHRYCYKISQVLVNWCCYRVLAKRGSIITSFTSSLLAKKPFKGHLRSPLPIFTVMDGMGLRLSNENCIENDQESPSLYLNKSFVSSQGQENEKGRMRVGVTDECTKPNSFDCDAKSVDCGCKVPELYVERSDVDSSPSDSDYVGLDMLFDMTKIVDKVKIKVREKREESKMQITVSSPDQSENELLGLQLPFDEANLSTEAKYKERRRKQGNSKKFSSASEFDGDSFHLGLLFEETKTINNGKVKTKKGKKMKKHLAAQKITENDSLGLEILFNDGNLVNEDGIKKKRKRKIVATEPGENDGVGAVKKYKPNHFVAIRVSNPKIHLSVKDFQASILKENAKLKPALIPLSSLHITVAVMHLDESSIEIARHALEKCKFKILLILNGVDFKLRFVGVGNFNKEVVFARVEEGTNLEFLNSINNIITAAFQEEGICVNEGKDWKPHLTLLKLSRKPALRKKGIRKVNDGIYAPYTDFYFGEEVVENVYLCSMFEQKEKDGFYKCVSGISLKTDEEVEESGEGGLNVVVTPTPDASYDPNLISFC